MTAMRTGSNRLYCLVFVSIGVSLLSAAAAEITVACARYFVSSFGLEESWRYRGDDARVGTHLTGLPEVLVIFFSLFL